MTNWNRKLIRAIPYANVTAARAVTVFFKPWTIMHGIMKIILTDNGPQFVCMVFVLLCPSVGTKLAQNTEYHQ